MKRLNALIALTAILLIGMVTFALNAFRPSSAYAEFDRNNNLLRPKGYRTWVFAGTCTTPKKLDSTVFFPDFQNIYIDPEGYKYWKEHGAWKEGTIFVKELLRAGDTVSAVGKGFYQGDHYSVSAMVKDSKRFPNMHNGWNYFRFTDVKNHILTDKSEALGAKCATCHAKSAIDGDIFYQYYPNILEAKGEGKRNSEDENTRKGLVANYKFQRAVSRYLDSIGNK